MPIQQFYWGNDELGLGSLGRDIHVREGHSTGSLLPRLRVSAVRPAGTSDMQASSYLAEQHNDVTFTFEPNFNGAQHGNAYEGLGLHVDTTTGEVTLQFDTPVKAENGTTLEFKAIAKEFTKEPFMLTFDVEGKDKIEGWPAQAAAPAAKKAAPRKKKQ